MTTTEYSDSTSDDSEDFRPQSPALKKIKTTVLVVTMPEVTDDKVQQQEKSLTDLLQEMITNKNPLISENDIHPRNKGRISSICGKEYNAHRVRLLERYQVENLASKIKYDIEEDGCWTSKAVHKKLPTFADPSSSVKRPRGVLLDKKHRGMFGSATFELAHITLAFVSTKNNPTRFPDSSEHEVSHLCHNPSCLNPDHMIWELHPANSDREKCRFTRALQCPCDCKHVFSLCTHDPKCIVCTCIFFL